MHIWVCNAILCMTRCLFFGMKGKDLSELIRVWMTKVWKGGQKYEWQKEQPVWIRPRRGSRLDQDQTSWTQARPAINFFFWSLIIERGEACSSHHQIFEGGFRMLQRGRGLWKAWSNYGRSVEFWYFQAFKWTQKRTMTPMPTEIDENMFFTPWH